MECHNNKPQPTPDTKRKRKGTEINQCKIVKASNFQMSCLGFGNDTLID